MSTILLQSRQLCARLALTGTCSMKLALLILTFGALTAFGQQSTLIGTIDRLAGGEFLMKTPTGSFTIHTNDRTEVLKDRTYHDLSPLKAGDEVSVRCEPDRNGKLAAIRIWASIVTFAATIHYVNGDDIEVVTNPNFDSHREEHWIVHLYPDTVFGTSREDVEVGQDIRVVGLDVGNGAVDAARIALYNTDAPVTK
jgi:hypothetical protein